MPFDFLKRQEGRADGGRAGAGARAGARRAAGIAFDGVTEEWRLVGRMLVEGRLSDALNKREPIAIADVQLGAGRRLRAADARRRGCKPVDPYDLVLVLAGERFAARR